MRRLTIALALLAGCGEELPPPVSNPDLAASRDFATPRDLATTTDTASSPDLAEAADLAVEADLATPSRDLAASPDLAEAADLSSTADLAESADLAAAADLAGPADLTPPSPDLAPPPDLTAPPDLVVPPLSITFYDINHILSTGQSLSVGSAGSPALSTMQPYANLRFNTGVIAGGTNLTSFVPLVETGNETMSSGLANLSTQMARDVLFKAQMPPKNSHEILISVHGVGGTAYSGLKKGTAAYSNGMAQVVAGKKVATMLNKSYVVRALTTVHGESDHVAKNANYDTNLLEWQSDYEKDVKALTGQTEPVPMFQTQMSAWTRYGQATSLIPFLQLAACDKRPDRVFMVGPKYMLPYADGVHLTNHGYRWLGEYHAKAYRHVVLEKQPWVPVRPKTIARNGAVITAVFHVPAPPLVLDTVLVTNPGSFGFAYVDETGQPPPIKSVAVTGPDTVTITLDKAPSGKSGRLLYAYSGTAGAGAGPTTGPRGNLRDSDATPSRNGYKLYNWAVHFDEPIP